MSHGQDVADRFDRISEIYDETREPLTKQALDKAALILSKDGCKRILEVGIGTGRISKPLQQRNFEIVGVDFSRGMLTKAQRKGMENLVMGDANYLPFEDKSVDATVLAHVLHLLENPAETFGRLARVTKNEIVAFVRSREDASAAGPSGAFPAENERSMLRQIFRKVSEEMGYTLPTAQTDWRNRFKSEIEFLYHFPPSELITIQDVAVVTTLGERLSFFEKRAYGYPTGIPEDIFHEMVKKMKSSIDTSKEIHYRRVEQMGIWRLPH